MNATRVALLAAFSVAASLQTAEAGQKKTRPYRLRGLYKRGARVIWGAECRGLAFGGQDQDGDDGRPHTRVLEGGQWRAIHKELRASNRLQRPFDRGWKLRTEARNILARARFIYFRGRPAREEAEFLKKQINPRLKKLVKEIDGHVQGLGRAAGGNDYARSQARFAEKHLGQARAPLRPFSGAVTAEDIKAWHRAQIHLELAAEALDAEPPPRALSPLVYDEKTRLYVLFGGDHLDYLTNDTWVFDPEKRRWLQRHPKGAPAPRANHELAAAGDGRVRLSGGYRYSSSTGYCSGQYTDIGDGEWTYDVERNVWTGGGELLPPDSREYRTGPFHPDFYLRGDKPDAAAWEAKLKALPLNEWVATNPPYRPRLNRDWGTAVIDTDRDMMLRWSGGHSAHGGTDVPHYHFSTNRWELPFPVEFPLDCLYSNTTYPNGYNFNLRPWMTGHTYQNYNYDPPSRKMVKAGRPRHFYVYDPDLGDWTGRGEKPKAMKYGSCFYTLTVAATPHGAVSWGKNARVHLFEGDKNAWSELRLSGDKLPGAQVDNSTICYDSRRDRVLIFRKPYGKTPYDGQVYALEMKTRAVKALSPGGMAGAARFVYIDRCTYDAANDLVLIATYLGPKDAEGHTPTPALDCAQNRWVALDIKYQLTRRGRRTRRGFPHGRSAGVMFDPGRKLIWGTETNSQVYVLRLEAKAAGMRPLETE